MIYLKETDINAHIQIRLKDESQKDFNGALEIIEKENIDFVKAYLANKYDVSTIFNEETPVLNGLLTKILTNLTLYALIRRNAARKVPSDYKEMYEEALKLLNKINNGDLDLELPLAVDDSGSVLSDTFYDNNSNQNFYL